MKNKFILSALALLGFSSCVKPSENNLDMYGTPIEDYLFKGKLTDADGNPIKGIAVQVDIQDVVMSNENGNFSSEFIDYISDYHSVTFTDVDGDANGGEFEPKQMDIMSAETNDNDRSSKVIVDLRTVILDKKVE